MSTEEIRKHLFYQLEKMFAVTELDKELVGRNLERAIERTEYCYSFINNSKNQINIYNSLQWFVFLYYLSNTIFQTEVKIDEDHDQNRRHLCDKIYMLNKSISCCEVYYEVELPDIFQVAHPVGSVIGRGTYGDGFLFYQGCTVGSNTNGKPYPKLGKNVFMYAHSSVIGGTVIGDNVIISANTYIKNEVIPSNVIVYGRTPNLVIKKDDKKIEEIIKREYEGL